MDGADVHPAAGLTTSVKPLVVVMGVSGSGKSTVGRAMADWLGVPFCEGDALHAASNVAKMHAGLPLDDADRAPWLARINGWLRSQPCGGVASCSALRRVYRDRLRNGLADRLLFVVLDPPRAVLLRRLTMRTDHFMPVSLLDSQLATLERPSADERALRLTGDKPVKAVVDVAAEWLAGDAATAGVQL